MARNFLIVGASRGLGRNLARCFHEQHWNVIATCRDDKGAEALAGMDGVRIERVDICNPASRDALVCSLKDILVDVAFINAGVSGPAHARWSRRLPRKSANCS